MPAVVRRTEVSPAGGTRDEDGTWRWSFDSKNSTNLSRMSFWDIHGVPRSGGGFVDMVGSIGARRGARRGPARCWELFISDEAVPVELFGGAPVAARGGVSSAGAGAWVVACAVVG